MKVGHVGRGAPSPQRDHWSVTWSASPHHVLMGRFLIYWAIVWPSWPFAEFGSSNQNSWAKQPNKESGWLIRAHRIRPNPDKGDSQNTPRDFSELDVWLLSEEIPTKDSKRTSSVNQVRPNQTGTIATLPCSVDCISKLPTGWFEYCRGFLGGFCLSFRPRKKGIKKNICTSNLPSPPSPPLQGGPWHTLSSLCLGPLFLCKTRKDPKHEEMLGWGA